MIFCFALYPFTRGRARTVQVVLAYGILFCIISLHTWSCTHCSSCPSVWYFVLHYIPSHVVVYALFKLSQRMVFCFALYPFTRGRARTVQVVLAYGILFCIISLHTWSCIHCSSCPSLWYLFALYPFTCGRARTVQVLLACYFILHYIPPHVVVRALFMLSQRMVFCFALYPSHVDVHALFKLSQLMVFCFA